MSSPKQTKQEEPTNFKYPNRCSKFWNVEKQKDEWKQYLGAGHYCSPEMIEEEEICCYKTGEICPETGYSFTECDLCGDGILEEDEEETEQKLCAMDLLSSRVVDLVNEINNLNDSVLNVDKSIWGAMTTEEVDNTYNNKNSKWYDDWGNKSFNILFNIKQR